MDNQNNQNNINTGGWGPYNASAPQGGSAYTPEDTPTTVLQETPAYHPQGAPVNNPQGAPVNNPQGVPVYHPQGAPAPAPQGGKNKKMIIIIAVAAVVVIAGIVCAIIFLGGDKSDSDKTTASASTTASQTTNSTTKQETTNDEPAYSGTSDSAEAVEMLVAAIEDQNVDLFMQAIAGTGSYKKMILSNTSMTESEFKENIKAEINGVYTSIADDNGSGFDMDIKIINQTEWDQSRIDDFAQMKGITPTAGCDLEVQEYVNGKEFEKETLQVVQIDGEWIVIY